jgi:TonB family protein
MKIVPTLLLLVATLFLPGQQSDVKPFSQFEKAVQNEQGKWAGSKERLSTVFDAERRRLGDAFETELLKWLGSDPEKHYWISAFVESESYLHGNKPLPHLSLLVKEQGLALVREKKDRDSRGYLLGLSVTAAIVSSELGLERLATSHKTQAERLLIEDPELSTSFPALSRVDHRRYDAIESAVKSKFTAIVADSDPPPHATISGGVLNGKASKLPKSAYPANAHEAGASGKVEVRIVIDEMGNVIWARAISGHPLLQKPAEEAALQTKFPVTKLSGQPVRVSGLLLYNFVP